MDKDKKANLASPIFTGEVKSLGGNVLRFLNSNASTGYGAFLRKDGANLYFMTTLNNDALGTWTSARPLTIDLAGGVAHMVNPVVGTQATADNSTKAASTAYVKNNLSSYAPLASPVFSGSPKIGSQTITTMEWAQQKLDNVIQVEIGQNARSGMSYIDFHAVPSGGTVFDNDARIYVTRTTNAGGLGSMSFTCGNLYSTADFQPSQDGYKQLGTATHRWSTVYAQSGVIQTSDRNEKKDIKPLDIEQSQKFILSLNPVEYKYKNGERPHFGLISQEVKEAMDNANIEDFAGFIKSPIEEDGETRYSYGLRYEEFISPLISIVQTQQKTIDNLTKRLENIEKD